MNTVSLIPLIDRTNQIAAVSDLQTLLDQTLALRAGIGACLSARRHPHVRNAGSWMIVP
jgi:hypothetical protein